MATKTISICNVCNEAISGRVISALDKTWHPEHFVCEDCKKPIGGTSFHQKDGKLYCVNDYMNNHMRKCKKCGESIIERTITALDGAWHEACFTCKKCKKMIGYGSFREKKGEPYCIPCHNKYFGSRCVACTRLIESKLVVAMEKNWHEECFKCSKCGKTIEDAQFAVRDKKALCVTCNKLY